MVESDGAMEPDPREKPPSAAEVARWVQKLTELDLPATPRARRECLEALSIPDELVAAVLDRLRELEREARETEAADEASLEGREVDGLRFVSRIDEGGQAEVWLAEEQDPRRWVAVKLYRETSSSSDPFADADRLAEVGDAKESYESVVADEDGARGASLARPDALRVVRGGSFGSRAREARTAYRYARAPGLATDYVGFRPSRVVTYGSTPSAPEDRTSGVRAESGAES